MKVLWLCNIMLPALANHLGLKASNKEGWLSGISETVEKNNDFSLAIACPVSLELDGFCEKIDGIEYYGFYEDTVHPENYDEGLESRLLSIKQKVNPDIVHVFGTEFPHTLAICRIMKDESDNILIGMQGVVGECASNYANGVPAKVVKRKTFRDRLKHDSIAEQIDKFKKRSENEIKAIEIAGNVTGRTKFDREYVEKINPNVRYHFMNETLRPEFYDGSWEYGKCKKNSIFLSQGNYPIKGVHYVFEALGVLKIKYPDISVNIAGDIITANKTIKDKIKISSYGKYLREQIKKYNISQNVNFIGNKTASEIKDELLKCNLFICPSTVENSPNSLGEAMLLAVPSVAANVGGVSSVFTENLDGLLYAGGDVDALITAVDSILSNSDKAGDYGRAASEHARKTHDPETNYSRLLQIYSEIKECV